MIEARLILEAIATKRLIEVTYNRVRMKLAPHVLYTRHGDPFLDAVAIERDGVAAREQKLGTFKLAGLQDGEIVAGTFTRFPDFDGSDERYHETTPFAVD